LQDIIFIDKGRIVLHEDIDELKQKYFQVIIDQSRKDELESHNAQLILSSLGKVSGIVESTVKIDDAQYLQPTLSDLFLLKVGGSHE